MTDQASQERDPVEVLAEEFLRRRRRGEVPSLKEYTDRYPHLADEIRDVFPALVMMDDIDPRSAELGRSLGGTMDLRGRPKLRQLGDFRILREIGQGGMGVVYEARQESLGRHVALKVLPPAAGRSEMYRERFQREARAAARLHHTNIVPIFGVGEDGGALYYAMQFIQGQSLDVVLEDVKRMRGLATTLSPAEQPTLVRQGAEAARGLLTGEFKPAGPDADNGPGAVTPGGPGPLLAPVAVPPPSDGGMHSGLGNQPETRYYRSIAWLGVQTAEGLAHAHAQGILHRDIKPSNLLLDAQGTLWITDFGLAKTEDSGDLTHTGEMVGTLRYMAPERFEGRGDVRSDVYALGVTLYEMLTLVPPFTGGDRVSLMGQIAHDTPPPPSRLAPLLPRDLETIVLKAMARDPAARYATAHDLADDLRRFLENRPIKARRSSAFEHANRWCRRNPAIASLLAILFFLVSCLAVGGMAVVLWLSEKRQAQALAEERTERLYHSLVAQANANRFSHRVGQRFATLDAVRKAAELVRERHMPAERLDELRKLAISALALPDLRTIKTWEGCPGDTHAWDADDQLRLYARSTDQGIISLRRIDTDREVARLRGGSELRFGPGGRFLLAYGEHRFRVWDVSRAKVRVACEGEENAFAFHPDGRHLLMGRRDGSLWIYDLRAPSQPPGRFGKLPRPARALSYDFAGTRLAVISEGTEGQARILDAGTAKPVALIPEAQPATFLAWHPSGNYLALVTLQRELHLWDLRRMKRAAALWGHRNVGGRATFTPDGDGLLAESWRAWGRGLLRLWDWRTGKQTLQHAGISNLQFGPAGHLLIQDGNRLSRAAFAGGREYRSIVQQSGVGKDVGYGVVAVHPGGRLVANNMSDCTRLFDLETGDELAAVPQKRYQLAFQADGALLTNGDRGLLRWPIRETRPGQYQVGPPELLYPVSYVDMASDRRGEVIGQANLNGALLVRPGKGTVFVGPHRAAQHVTISPDGRYAATGINDGEEGVKVWDVRARRLLTHLPLGSHCGGQFSPDGRWLAAGGRLGRHVVRVGTWEAVFSGWDGHTAFSPDGSLFVAASKLGVVRLLETGTWRELARLEDANQASDVWLGFTPDGSRLLTVCDEDRNIHVWDLRAIRAGLAEMGLDWDAPRYPHAGQTAPVPLHVTVQPGNLFVPPRTTVGLCSFRLALNPFDFEAYFERGRAYGRLKENRQAIADYSRAFALMPANHPSRGEVLWRRANNYLELKDQSKADADLHRFAELDCPLPEGLEDFGARQCNNLAWRHVAGPEKERDPKKALPLARKAVRLNAQQATYLNTLGVVYYRLGRYRQAADTLRRSLREGRGDADAYDLFFLAMCHAQTGAADKARICFDRAVRWVRENPGRIQATPQWGEELKRFRAEAEEVLKPLPRPK
jgi:serine/threonine protein kinase/WD40 repeat protein/tetratricopeptide (TPR) repeat protein